VFGVWNFELSVFVAWQKNMRFKYLAKKGPKETVEGSVEAANKEEASRLVISQGLFPVRVERSEAKESKPHRSLSLRISQAQLLNFSRHLYNLLRAHVEVLKALGVLQKQADSPSLGALINEIYQKVKEGADLSRAMEDFPAVFSPFYTSSIRVGEVSGRLDFSLERICNYLEQRQDIRRKVISSLAYPIMMIVVGIGTVIVLFTFVIPRLSSLFLDLGQELPFITKVLLDIADLFSSIVFWWAVAVVAVLCLLYQKFSPYKISLKKILKATPFFKKILLLEAVTTFSYTLSLLLKSGVSLLEALDVSQATLQDERLSQEVKMLREEVLQGASLTESVERLKSFPKFFSHMVAIGEEAGLLSEVMDTTTEVLSKDLDVRLRMFSSLIEPVIIFCVGIVLGAVVIALLLPILQMGTLSM